MSLKPYVRLTAAEGGPSLTLSGNFEVARDAIGNVTFTWRDPVTSWSSPARVSLESFEPYLSESVDVRKNRLAVLLAITDPGGVLVVADWREIDPWQGILLDEESVTGVAALGNARATPEEDGFSIVLYKSLYRFERGTGVLEEAS